MAFKINTLFSMITATVYKSIGVFWSQRYFVSLFHITEVLLKYELEKHIQIRNVLKGTKIHLMSSRGYYSNDLGRWFFC